MGYIDELDVVAGLAALEMVLSDLGLDIEPGCRRDRRAAGLARAQGSRQPRVSLETEGYRYDD